MGPLGAGWCHSSCLCPTLCSLGVSLSRMLKSEEFIHNIASILMRFFLYRCISSRRRRRRGLRPFYGTGWMAPPKYPGPPGQGPDTYPPPPPAYGAPHQTPAYTGTSFNTNNGYYGHHEGIQMTPQPPQNTYHPSSHQQANGANQEYFAPPPGPPPAK